MKPIGSKTRAKPAFDAEGYQAALQSLNGDPLPDLKRLRARPLQHGGTRPGAGRKPTGNQPVLLRLSPSTLRKLRQAAHRRKQNLSATAEESLQYALSCTPPKRLART